MLHLQISLASETVMRRPEHVLCGRPGEGSEWVMLAFAAARGSLCAGTSGDPDSSTALWEVPASPPLAPSVLVDCGDCLLHSRC